MVVISSGMNCLSFMDTFQAHQSTEMNQILIMLNSIYFIQGKLHPQKLNINFYCVAKRNFHGAFPISTENQKILRSFELNNEIAAGINGESLFDKNFQLQQEINDIKKQARQSKLKIALGKTKYDGLMKRYDAEVRRLKDEHKKQLDQKDEEIANSCCWGKKKSLQIQQMEELQWN